MNIVAKDIVEQRVAGFLASCRARGIKATHQRLEIMRELAASDDHPDAETVYMGVRARIPTISLDTVYRTLRLLEDENVISRVSTVSDRARFDANTARHHHFVCSECGLIRDFYSDELERVVIPSALSDAGTVESVYVELRGVCKACRETRAGGEA